MAGSPGKFVNQSQALRPALSMERSGSANNSSQELPELPAQAKLSPVRTPNAIEKQLDGWVAFMRSVDASFDECAACNAGSYLEDYQVLGALQLVRLFRP